MSTSNWRKYSGKMLALPALLLLSSLCVWTSVGAQEGRRGRGPEQGPPPGRDDWRPGGPPNPSFMFVGPEGRFGGKTVKGAPYSAETETETIQPLADGSRIVRKTTANVYRDSEGRTRREQTLHNIGPYAAAGDAPQLVFIDDPVAGVNYVLDPQKRTARKMQFRGGRPPGPPQGKARPDDGTDNQRRPPAGPPPERERPQREGAKTKTEALGKRMIEGVEAEGTRTTVIIPAGQIGNERQLEIVSERWYSPALQEVVLSTHRDPRLGEHTYRLKNINRAEPARSLFEAPADYTLSEDRRGEGRGKRPFERD